MIYPSKHTKLFQRCHNVVDVQTTLYQRFNALDPEEEGTSKERFNPCVTFKLSYSLLSKVSF